MQNESETVAGLIPEWPPGGREAPAVYYGGRALSFAELDRDSRRAAAGLARLGVGPGDRVALWLPNMPAWLVLYLACARLAAIAVSVNTRFRATELDDILARSGARVLAYSPGFRGIDFTATLRDAGAAGRLDHVVACGAVIGADEIPYHDLTDTTPLAEDRAAPDAGSIVFTTSGTTRAPKFVLHDQRSVVRHARLVAADFGYDGGDAVMLQALPLCGVFGFCQAMASLAAGRPMVMLPAFDAAEAVASIARYGVTHMNATDDMYRAMFAAAGDARPFQSLRLAGFAAFNMDAAALDAQAGRHGVPLVGLYGMSEVQALFARQRTDDPDARRIQPGGRMVAPGAVARVRDPATGDLLPPGACGELELRGPSRMRLYFGDPDATAEALTDDGFVRTGDLACLRDDGGFTFVSRMGDALRLGGFLVSPAEIEAEMCRFPGVDSCQVVGAFESARPCAVAFVTLSTGAPFDERAMREHCATRLARFKVPERVVALDEFPAVDGPNGRKIQRGTLRAMAQDVLGGAASGRGR